MKKKFLQMFLCSVLVSIFLIGCGEAKDSTVNESQTIINQEANEIESETNQTKETSNVSESVVVDANDRWGGMTEKELALLTPEEIVKACELSVSAGADYVKTSTGFGKYGATVEDVALMRKTVGPNIGVKASGGVRTREDMLKMIEAGASRIGTSAGKTLMQE